MGHRIGMVDAFSDTNMQYSDTERPTETTVFQSIDATTAQQRILRIEASVKAEVELEQSRVIFQEILDEEFRLNPQSITPIATQILSNHRSGIFYKDNAFETRAETAFMLWENPKPFLDTMSAVAKEMDLELSDEIIKLIVKFFLQDSHRALLIQRAYVPPKPPSAQITNKNYFADILYFPLLEIKHQPNEKQFGTAEAQHQLWKDISRPLQNVNTRKAFVIYLDGILQSTSKDLKIVEILNYFTKSDTRAPNPYWTQTLARFAFSLYNLEDDETDNKSTAFLRSFESTELKRAFCRAIFINHFAAYRLARSEPKRKGPVN